MASLSDVCIIYKTDEWNFTVSQKHTCKEGYTAGTTHMRTSIVPHTSPFHHSTVKGVVYSMCSVNKTLNHIFGCLGNNPVSPYLNINKEIGLSKSPKSFPNNPNTPKLSTAERQSIALLRCNWNRWNLHGGQKDFKAVFTQTNSKIFPPQLLVFWPIWSDLLPINGLKTMIKKE